MKSSSPEDLDFGSIGENAPEFGDQDFIGASTMRVSAADNAAVSNDILDKIITSTFNNINTSDGNGLLNIISNSADSCQEGIMDLPTVVNSDNGILNSDCHLSFLPEGQSYENNVDKVSASETDPHGNHANPVVSGLVGISEFITMPSSNSTFPFVQPSEQSFQTVASVNEPLLDQINTSDILPAQTLQSQIDSFLSETGQQPLYTSSSISNYEQILTESDGGPSLSSRNNSESLIVKQLQGEFEKTSQSSLSSTGTPGDSPASPNDNLIIDADTQASLIQKSEKLHLDSLPRVEGFWSVVDDNAVDEPCKAHKPDKNTDAPSSLRASQSTETIAFDAGGATSSSDFAFQKSDGQTCGLFTFDTQSFATSVTNTELKTTKVSVLSLQRPNDGQKGNHQLLNTQTHLQKKSKEPSLNSQFPSKAHGFELRILEQPEEQHRARYMTEGSRGAVKDRSQQGYPVVKLFGHCQSALLQIFVGTDTGKVKPHPFYQACKVCGKNSTPCTEKDIDGTIVIDIDLNSTNDMMASVDCVGILKLRNADVEQRIGVTKSKKRSTRARLIFRASFQKTDGCNQILQVASTAIVCTQPIGQPEVCRLSMTECSVKGNEDLFIIGKNFMKGTKVFFQELDVELDQIIWEKEATIDKDYFQPTHLICTVPEYYKLHINEPVTVKLSVSSAGKLSDLQNFTYKPLETSSKKEVPMEVDQQQKPPAFSAAPAALELIKLIQQTPPSTIFQLPSDSISPVYTTACGTQSSQSFSSQDQKIQLNSVQPHIQPQTSPLVQSPTQLQVQHQSHPQQLQQQQSQFQPQAQAQSSTQIPSIITAPQVILVGNPNPVMGQSNVFSIGGSSVQTSPSIFIIQSLSNVTSGTSQENSQVQALLQSLFGTTNQQQ